MKQTIFATFASQDDASEAINNLEKAGYNPKQDLTVAMRDGGKDAGDAVENAAEGAVSGAGVGSAVGAVVGLLAGIGAIAIPGGLLIGGPIAAALGITGTAAATTLSGAVTGAAAGGLVGGLIGLGVPETEAREYESIINQGGVFVAVPVRDNNETMAMDILNQHNAQNVRRYDLND